MSPWGRGLEGEAKKSYPRYTHPGEEKKVPINCIDGNIQIHPSPNYSPFWTLFFVRRLKTKLGGETNVIIWLVNLTFSRNDVYPRWAYHQAKEIPTRNG